MSESYYAMTAAKRNGTTLEHEMEKRGFFLSFWNEGEKETKRLF